MEELLNKLIEEGWKPFGKGWLNLRKLSGIHKWWLLLHEPSTRVADNYSLRDLVSKESWLWQFVCENGMVKKNDNVRIKNYRWDNECDDNCCYDEYQYRLIESALTDEDKLEDFILSNIKLD